MKLKNLSLSFKKIDWFLLLTICLLILLGLILLYSVALGSQTEQNFLNLKKQIVFFVLSVVVALLIAFFVDFRILIKYNYLLYGLGVVLLLVVLFFGKTIRGTTGWFNIAGLSFQPVELVKVFLIVYLSKFFSDKAKYISQLKYLLLSSLGVIFLMILILLQPDFGSALILFGLWLILILITGVRKSHLLILASLLIISLLFSWFFLFKDYQKERINVFLNPSLDPLGSGYNISQSIIAIGSGGLWGKGLALGSQSQLKFLPEAQTDFIFAVLAEELGFIGILLLLGLFTFLFYRLIKVAKSTRDNFALYLVISITTLFFIQTMVNIGGNLGLLPITGIPLPFISYGGSSLLSNMILIGLVESIIIRS